MGSLWGAACSVIISELPSALSEFREPVDLQSKVVRYHSELQQVLIINCVLQEFREPINHCIFHRELHFLAVFAHFPAHTAFS